MVGSGAFGEVWLARSLTGSLRAIKVVRREDFDSGGSYEREFHGIQRYEPISRQHPALVDILQVGRNDDLHFYYCVMELADDISASQTAQTETEDDPTVTETTTGGVKRRRRQRKIDPDTYEPDILSY